jgi:hypothetical protein
MEMKRVATVAVLLLVGHWGFTQNFSGVRSGVSGGAGVGPFIGFSTSGAYLVNPYTQHPLFLVGEDAFTLVTQLSTSDATTYLSDRAGRGYNFIWVAAADNVYQSNAPKNYYGASPFDSADFTSEDAAYWAHVDLIVKMAASYGITVGLGPGFCGLANSEGYRGSYLSASDTTVNGYGAWLGARYQPYPNILWVLGGDCDPTDTGLYEKLNQLATGIRSADSTHAITIEAARFYEAGGNAPNNGWSSLDAWGSSVTGAYQAAPAPSWLTMNWVYNDYTTQQTGCSRNYTAYVVGSPHTPGAMGEAWYEGEHSTTVLQLREQEYWSVLSGCSLGFVFGNNPIWCFDSPQSVSACNTGTTWQSQLASSGSVAHQYFGQLFRSREFWKLIPDSGNVTLTAGYGSGLTISVAARTSDGQTVLVYVPNGNATTVTVNMAKITDAGATVNEWWFNPSTAATTHIGTAANTGSANFTPPDSNDWVLVLDSNAAALPAPGGGAL